MPDDVHLEAAATALLDPALEPIVEMVLRRDDDGSYLAASAEGEVRFTRTEAGDSTNWEFRVVGSEGHDPLGEQRADRFAPLEAEQANPFPARTENAYPFGYEQVAQLFDAAEAPDFCVIHSAAHNWEDQGGHRGEHGSIDVIQARAPFIIGGAGVHAHGMIPEACRLIDVAPTVAALLRCAPTKGVGQNGRPLDVALLTRQDGRVLEQVIDGRVDRPDHVVGFLFDGANANVLYDMAARGEAPNVARLMAMGTTFGHGAMSSLPTVTLANHTSILTGAQPGHHGILHNAWWDRARQEQVITNSPATWPQAMARLAPGVETLHDAVHRTWAGAFTASINEPCDTGADYSTFGVLRAGGELPHPPPSAELPHATERFVRPVKEYKWASLIDHTAIDQAAQVWSGQSGALPRFCWVNFTLTDAAFHEGGPYSDIAAASVRDTDARVGDVLAMVEAAGVFDRTAFFLVADHGMEESNPDVTGDWGDALRDTGIPFRDEGFGFIYVDPYL